MKTSVVQSNWIQERDNRLDATVYDPDVLSAIQLIQRLATTKVGEIANIWLPGRFKRCSVESEEYGIPFLGTSDILETDPAKAFSYYISRTNTPNIEELVPTNGSILVTRSGTIGNCVYVTETLSRMAVSEHAIRLEPKQSNLGGLVYTYLSSSVGRSLVQSQMYGSVVDEVTPDQISNLPIPMASLNIANELQRYVSRCGENRENAAALMRSANDLLAKQLNLKPLMTRQSNSFQLTSMSLALRLDASYYDPPGRQAVAQLKDRPDCRLLGDVTKRIFHPFRMNMVLVGNEYGVPFLGGGDIVQIRYYGDKYISSVTEQYEEYLVKKGWTLMSIGGTIGRVTYVGDYLNGAAASQHVTRIVPRAGVILPGYLNVYMETEYAQYQIKNLIYGSVVDTIRESQLQEMLIPVPPMDAQRPIHDLVEEAYRLRYEANRLEDEAQALLTKALGFES